MAGEIDTILAEIRQLSERIEACAPGPEMEALEAQRASLRAKARMATDATRSLANLRAELDNIESQLREMANVAIKPAQHENYKLITDPSAYRQRINASIAANAAERRQALERRRAELVEAMADRH